MSAVDLSAVQAGTKSLSRRMTLSLLQSQFDPLGLISPALLKGKMMLRELHTLDLAWDGEIPSQEKAAWVLWLRELAQAKEVTFSRATRPVDTVGGPSLAGFADSSLIAYCAAVYVIYSLAGGGFSS